MDCRHVRGALSALLDGELAPAERARVEDHLAACRRCRRIYEQYRQDQLALARHLRTASWLPIEERPWERPGQRPPRSFWGMVVAGGNKLAAGAALVALLALVTVGALALRGMANGGSQPDPSATAGLLAATEPASAIQITATPAAPASGQAISPSQIIRELARAGLVFDINQPVEIDGQRITLNRLAVDRTVTYLEYTAPATPDGEALRAEVELLNDQGARIGWYASVGGARSAGPNEPPRETTNYLEFPGVDPSTRRLTLRFAPHDVVPRGATDPDVTDIEVPVDLSSLRALPPPQHIDAATTVNGVKAEVLTITRGAVVSSIDWRATAVDPEAIVPIDGGGSPDDHVLLMANGEKLPYLRYTRQGEDDWYVQLWVYQLPATGQLHLRLDKVAVSGLPGGGYTTVRGPWEFTIDLGESRAQPIATPTPRATPEPTTTPAAPPTPTPTPTPAPRMMLPADLYFLAPDSNGVMTLWLQPADGSEPVQLVKTESDITKYWLHPGTRTIAYQRADGSVTLLKADGQEVPATMPDGQPVAEYVPSPDGSQIAYITEDRTAIWLSDRNGQHFRMGYQVEQPIAQTIHAATWSPNSGMLLFQVSQIGGISRPVILGIKAEANTQGVVWEGNRDTLDVAWSPDASQIVYSRYGRIFRVTLRGGEETDITPTRIEVTSGQAILNLTWLTDGRIAFTLHEDSTVYSPAWLVLMQADGSDAWRVRELGPVDDLVWTPVPGGESFVVGLIESEADDGERRAGLIHYPSLHGDPQPLAPDVAGKWFTQLAWARR